MFGLESSPAPSVRIIHWGTRHSQDQWCTNKKNGRKWQKHKVQVISLYSIAKYNVQIRIRTLSFSSIFPRHGIMAGKNLLNQHPSWNTNRLARPIWCQLLQCHLFQACENPTSEANSMSIQTFCLIQESCKPNIFQVAEFAQEHINK